MPQIVIDINSDGNTTINVDKVVGDACTALTRDLEQLLGDNIHTTIKPEFYENQNTTTQQELN